MSEFGRLRQAIEGHRRGDRRVLMLPRSDAGSKRLVHQRAERPREMEDLGYQLLDLDVDAGQGVQRRKVLAALGRQARAISDRLRIG